MAFLIMTMRSIGSHERERLWREAADGGASLEEGQIEKTSFSTVSSNPEDALLDQESEDTVKAIYDLFADDGQAQLLILGWSEGVRGKDLRDLIGIDQTALDYLIKRVRRSMAKRYPNGWKK